MWNKWNLRQLRDSKSHRTNLGKKKYNTKCRATGYHLCLFVLGSCLSDAIYRKQHNSWSKDFAPFIREYVKIEVCSSFKCFYRNFYEGSKKKCIKIRQDIPFPIWKQKPESNEYAERVVNSQPAVKSLSLPLWLSCCFPFTVDLQYDMKIFLRHRRLLLRVSLFCVVNLLFWTLAIHLFAQRW